MFRSNKLEEPPRFARSRGHATFVDSLTVHHTCIYEWVGQCELPLNLMRLCEFIWPAARADVMSGPKCRSSPGSATVRINSHQSTVRCRCSQGIIIICIYIPLRTRCIKEWRERERERERERVTHRGMRNERT